MKTSTPRPTARIQVMLRPHEAVALARMAERSRSLSAMGHLAVRQFLSNEPETR